MIIGLDFDHTICVSKWPDVGRFKFLAKPVLRWMQKRGHTLILWTCREGAYLADAMNACTFEGIYFDYVNANSRDRIEMYGGDCRKLSCDMLVDDKAGFVWWPWVAVRMLWLEWRGV